MPHYCVPLSSPHEITIFDEATYLAQADAMSKSRMFSPNSFAMSIETDKGFIAKYPLMWPGILSLAIRVNSNLIYYLNILFVLVSTLILGWLLKKWGLSALWSLLLLFYPALLVFSPTIMSDISVMFFLICWIALLENKESKWLILAGVPIFFALATKNYSGIFLICIVGVTFLKKDYRSTKGLITFLVLSGFWFYFNHRTTGSLIWSGYDGKGLFELSSLFAAAPVHFAGLLLFYPLMLILGLLGLYRCKRLDLVLAVIGFLLLFSFYYFVHSGKNLHIFGTNTKWRE